MPVLPRLKPTPLAADRVIPPTRLEPELVLYADGTPVVMRVRDRVRSGVTAGMAYAPPAPYPFQLVRWSDGDRDLVAPHVLARGEQAEPARQAQEPGPAGDGPDDGAASPCEPRPDKVVRIVTVSMTRDVSALVELPNEPWDGAIAGITYIGTLAGFLARTDLTIPGGTPIMRFDRTPQHVAVAFSNGGPIANPLLPANTICRLRLPIQPYRGESWNALGWLTYASLDVYLRCAAEAGMVIEYSSGPAVGPGEELPRPVMHLTHSGPDAGDTLCGLTRTQVDGRGHLGVHASLAPQWMYTPEDTARFAQAQPHNVYTNVCSACQVAWISANPS